jgi:Cdc6-like AAA superfamily ATPase
VASRAALHQMRVIFNPYDKVQIQEILEMRLGELKLDFLTTSARNFIAIKASSVAGDLRAALKICQQVIELYRNHQEELALQQALEVKKRSNKKQRTDSSIAEPIVTVSEQDSNKFVLSLISEAVRAYRESPFIASVMRSTQLDKAVLIILTKFRRQGAATGEERCFLVSHFVWLFWSCIVRC